MTRAPEITEAERRALCGRVDITLDGQPAAICGSLQPFATVAVLPNGARYEYAWLTVARIVAAGGAFSS